jgi:hypothetical protein
MFVINANTRSKDRMFMAHLTFASMCLVMPVNLDASSANAGTATREGIIPQNMSAGEQPTLYVQAALTCCPFGLSRFHETTSVRHSQSLYRRATPDLSRVPIHAQ